MMAYGCGGGAVHRRAAGHGAVLALLHALKGLIALTWSENTARRVAGLRASSQRRYRTAVDARQESPQAARLCQTRLDADETRMENAQR
jgi:hypothetical protein